MRAASQAHLRELYSIVRRAQQTADSEESRLLADYMALVIATCRRKVRNRTIDDDDFQDAAVDLLMAIRRFDSSRGFAFATYAKTCMENGFTRRWRAARRKTQDGVEQEELNEAMLAVEGHVEQLIGEEHNRFHSRQILSRMGDRARRLVEGYFFKGKDMPTLADEHGVSKQHVHQTIHAAVKAARSALECEGELLHHCD